MKRLIVGIIVVVALMFSLSASNVFAQDACEGNFDCDQDVDGTDAAVFKDDFGRSPFQNPCQNCPPSAPVPKTGQTTTYATGDDGDLEKGVVWPNPRFTDNSDGTVTDNLTGLIWLKNANCFGTRTWNNALSDSNGLSSGSCGLTDGSNAGNWRLPNLFELESLRNMKYYDPCLSDTAGIDQWSEGDPFTNVIFGYYWSSTTITTNTFYAWLLSMHSCNNHFFSKDDSHYVWPVLEGHSEASTTTTTIVCIQQGGNCITSSECCDGCCCNALELNVCTTTEQCGFLGGGCD